MIQTYFKNKVYLILGANGRIGYSLSKELLKLGSKLILGLEKKNGFGYQG